MLELPFWILLLRFLYRLLEYYWLVIAIIMGVSSSVHLVTNTAIWLRYDDDNDDDEIRKKVTFTNFFINVLYCAVRQITRMWFSC